METETLLLKALRTTPQDLTLIGVLADYYAETSNPLLETQVRLGPPPIGLVFYGYGDGYGDGYGYGDGNGNGYGDGYGHGNGDGYGHNIILTLEKGRVMPEVGINQLIILPHGWVVCAFVKEQTGPYQFKLVDTVLICRTGGVPWDELADGGRRELATYRSWGTTTIGPQFIMSREWKGDLPKI